jgi:hypothetical protein
MRRRDDGSEDEGTLAAGIGAGDALNFFLNIFRFNWSYGRLCKLDAAAEESDAAEIKERKW